MSCPWALLLLLPLVRGRKRRRCCTSQSCLSVEGCPFVMKTLARLAHTRRRWRYSNHPLKAGGATAFRREDDGVLFLSAFLATFTISFWETVASPSSDGSITIGGITNAWSWYRRIHPRSGDGCRCFRPVDSDVFPSSVLDDGVAGTRP